MRELREVEKLVLGTWRRRKGEREEEYGCNEIGHPSRWKLGGQLLRGWYAKKPFLDYCRDCYKTTTWLKAYSMSIFLVVHHSKWNIPEDVRSKVVLPPSFRAQVGRPRKKRFKSTGEHDNGKTRDCTICKNLVTIDKIVRMLSLVRLLHHAHP
ncbi:hypothetical protein Ddye_019956 [Dipteronia dyeriana]|uniref:Uncharacterized protein n=1 Tax=Dipteronia dyeriana TaxID=168575 RepID=A0AAD9WVJ9_9ROSI|nr:hypothetical protein Ddye_019956 [Dipteronia dyeriana]